MKEELQSKLVEILGSIQTAAGKAGDFAMVQLPDIAQSYVMYGRVYHSFCLLVILLIFVSTALFFYRAIKKQDEGLLMVAGGLGMLSFFACIVLFLEGVLSNAMLVWFAPKVWLLKEIAGLIK